MKAIKGMLFFLIIVIGFVSINVNGNSGQLRDNQPGSFDLMPVEETDIYINHEDLLFDFTSNKVTNEYDYISAYVTATYEMINPGETKNIRMGFPYYISYLYDASQLDMSIMANDKEIQSELYFKFQVDQNDLPEMTFENALKGMISENYKIDDSLEGTLYTFKPTTNQFNVRVECDKLTKVVYNGFTGKSYENLEIEGDKILNLFYDNVNVDEDYWVFCHDGDIKITVETNGYSDYKTETITANALIDRYLENEYGPLEIQARGRTAIIRNNFNKAVGDSILHNSTKISDLDDYLRGSFLALMVYDVEMLGDSVANTVSVSYPSQASYDRSYEPTLYTMNYLTNPAKNWADFKSLDIKIIPLEDIQYVINTNLEFTKNDDGSYSLSMDKLPEDNIVFSFSSSETPKEKEDHFISFVLIILMLIPFVIMCAILVIAGIFIYKFVKKGNNTKSST
jgi:hypothetical protein